MEEDNPKTSKTAIALIWIAWFINVIFTLIMMLNFLIAEVGATYSRVVSLGSKNHYRQASAVNKKYYLMFYFCRNMSRFRYDALVFTTRMDAYEDMDDEQTNRQNSVQLEIQNVVNHMDKKLDKNKKQMENMRLKTNALDEKFTKFLK